MSRPAAKAPPTGSQRTSEGRGGGGGKGSLAPPPPPPPLLLHDPRAATLGRYILGSQSVAPAGFHLCLFRTCRDPTPRSTAAAAEARAHPSANQTCVDRTKKPTATSHTHPMSASADPAPNPILPPPFAVESAAAAVPTPRDPPSPHAWYSSWRKGGVKGVKGVKGGGEGRRGQRWGEKAKVGGEGRGEIKKESKAP